MKRLVWRTCGGLTFILLGALFSSSACGEAPSPPPDAAAVDAAIQKGIDYLEGVEVNGSWDAINEPFPNKQQACGGYSALATYALLAAGAKPSDPHLVAALTHLAEVGPQMTGVYALGMRCQVWATLPPDVKYRPYIAADGVALLEATKHNTVPGLWRYLISDTDWDLSASQYGVLGLWACAERGLEIPESTWQHIENAWLSKQYSDGSWGYQPAGRQNPGGGDFFHAGRTTLTAAGIASLFITQEYLHGDEGVNCAGNINNRAIDAAMAWLAEHAADLERFPPYTLYAYERIGVASGYKYFGTYNWYSQGAAVLLKGQQADGSISIGGLGPVADTSLALLFLVRGRAPVIMNKLRYSIDLKGTPIDDTHWNQRPRDAANATRWMGKELETDLNWQLVTLDAPVEELHDAPILYLAGNQPVTLTAAQENKLRTFVQEGGTILGNADCASKEFIDGFKKLGGRLFPDYEFAQLKKDSAVFTYPALIKEHRNVFEQSNGVRPLLLLLADDPAKRWQLEAGISQTADFQMLENILLYVQDAKHLMYKGQSFIVTPDATIVAARHISVARLQYPGNCDPEPGGWRRLSAIVHNDRKTDLQIDTIKLGDGKLDNHYQVADLTGTAAFTLGDAKRADLKKFIEGGGTVIFDAAGGDGAFADSARAEIAAMFPDSPLVPLPAAHAVLQIDGKPIEAQYRAAARKLIHGHGVRLKGLDLKGRTAVFFSGDDLASALVGQPTGNIAGYDPATASLLMANILDYASGQPAATAPATTQSAPATMQSAP